MPWDAEIDGAAAAVDEGTGADGESAELSDDVHDFAGGAAGSDDVFDDEAAFSGLNGETAAKLHDGILPFGEEGADAEGAGDFMRDDDAAERGGDDQIDGADAGVLSGLFAEFGAERRGDAGMLKNERALQIAIAVKPRREEEMSLQQGLILFKDVEYVFSRHSDPMRM